MVSKGFRYSGGRFFFSCIEFFLVLIGFLCRFHVFSHVIRDLSQHKALFLFRMSQKRDAYFISSNSFVF